jgi:hypothetical protein
MTHRCTARHCNRHRPAPDYIHVGTLYPINETSRKIYITFDSVMDGAAGGGWVDSLIERYGHAAATSHSGVSKESVERWRKVFHPEQ